MEVIIDGIRYVPENVSRETLTCTDVFEKYIGTQEYTGIVETIQKWYYGSLVKSSWCATSLSWCLAQLGIMKYSIGTKQENVKLFADALIKTGTAKELKTTENFKRGDILVFNWDMGELKTTSSKHITTVYKDTLASTKIVQCLGGNQSDMIRVTGYERDYINCAFRPDYTKNTIDRL